MMLRILLLTAITLLALQSSATAQLSHVFIEADRIDNTNALYVSTSAEGTVFMSDPFSGLHIYDWDDATFSNSRSLNLPGNEGKMAVRPDSVVFLVGGTTLYAISYGDSSMTNVGQVNDASFFTSVDEGPGDVVFATTSFGLRAYHFSDSTFNLLAMTAESIFDNAKHIVVRDDSTLIVAGGGNGFYAFSFYGDSTFTPLDTLVINQAESVAINTDGTLYFANSNVGGVLAYAFDGVAFDSLAQWKEPQGALDVAVGPDGTIFVANSLDGLHALTFDGTSFTNTAHIDLPGTGIQSVAVGPDGTVFVAGGTGGWAAYSYALATGVGDEVVESSTGITLEQNFPNPVRHSTSISFSLQKTAEIRLKLYDLQGREIRSLVDEMYSPGKHSVDFDARGLANGMYLYRLNAENTITTKAMMVIK